MVAEGEDFALERLSARSGMRIASHIHLQRQGEWLVQQGHAPKTGCLRIEVQIASHIYC